MKSVFLKLFVLSASLLLVQQAFAVETNFLNNDRIKVDTASKIEKKISPLLERFCGNLCEILGIDVQLKEKVPEVEDLGFENVEDDASRIKYLVEKATVHLQIDKTIPISNKDKLYQLLSNHLKPLGFPVDFDWLALELPHIGQTDFLGDNLKEILQQKLEAAIYKIIQEYCPESCILAHINIEGKLINIDELNNLNATQYIKDKTGTSVYKIDNITITVSMDQALGQEVRDKIINIMKAQTHFASPIRFNAEVTNFPETFSQKQDRLNASSQDPFGLEKLRRTLTLFKELAAKDAPEDNSNKWWIGFLILILLIGAGVFAWSRIQNAKRDAELMVNALRNAEKKPTLDGPSVREKSIQDLEKEMLFINEIQNLKEQLVKMFLQLPKVAKETFTRILKDEGFEEASKYIHLFGKIVVFELLADPSLHRDLNDLGEYYHKSKFQFTLEEELHLLKALKTKVTANEIRMLAKKTMDQFDFLLKLDPSQVFTLISDENPQVQSIVLSQLQTKTRRSIFNMFEGDSKIKLLRELSKADSIPKEYLTNVANALNKKVLSKPELDTHNLRSSDILLDLLERSNLLEQRALMKTLGETNPDAARAIKHKLVTIEMVPYLKDGHLLELVMGLETKDLSLFLVGSKKHIRDTILSHAPDELRESWFEEIENIVSVDEEKYRLVEMMILGKIRHLASLGAINLLDINEMIFKDSENPFVSKEKKPSDIPIQKIVA